MQTNLFELFSKISSSYYDIPIQPENLFTRADACEEFIHEHFLHGHKSSVFEVDFLERYKQQGKHEHTVSLYLLGLHLQGLFESEIKAYLVKYIPEVGKWYGPKEFKYFWYLTCLYHDAASCVEEMPNYCDLCCGYCPKRLFINKRVKKAIQYKMHTITNYCRYRKESGKQDHGIYGGMMLYRKLYKNFQVKTAGRTLPWKDENGLIWRDEQKDVFACVAGAIICHNMWTVSADDAEQVKKYHDMGLDELIISEEEDKRSINDYPLQFMLCLLDTIEPVKRFKKLSALEVLKNVSIEAKNREITIAWTARIKEQADFWDWMKNISTLKDWLRVDVSACKQDGECTITIQ
jgi:hypothetical protein